MLTASAERRLKRKDKGVHMVAGRGVPVKREGAFVAGGGVSGGTVKQDVAIVEAALR
jgi:uncharacterized protein GlcG (DUF336 family)